MATQGPLHSFLRFSIYFKYFVVFSSYKNNENFCKRKKVFINDVMKNKFDRESHNICMVKCKL